jgi:alanine transaminase
MVNDAQAVADSEVAHTPLVGTDSISSSVFNTVYAVRGEIVLRAAALEKRLQQGDSSLPFDKVEYCNIGNPQALGQKPITFYRQVLSLVDYPDLLEHPKVGEIYPQDVIQRANSLVKRIPGGTGAYSTSKGADFIREQVADFIERRDEYPANKENIFMYDGASPAVHAFCKLFLRSASDCILTPMPHYPLYSACISLYGGTLLPYYLDESMGWALDVNELKQQVDSARSSGNCVRALVVINPGNPTGQCLPVQNQVDVVNFCRREGLVLIADEVYQENVYAMGKSFTSFKKVVRDLGYDDFPLMSMHSISKGFYGECGRRGGYAEMYGFPEETIGQFYKLASINLCPNTNGQICMSMVVNPPKKGEPSYDQFIAERQSILDSLHRRSKKLVSALNELEGVSCNEAEGALYAFPSIQLPDKAVQAAKEQGRNPDNFYCISLLDEAGICVVPGTGFGQKENTFHFRTTFLPAEDDIDSVIQRLTDFHNDFISRYKD